MKKIKMNLLLFAEGASAGAGAAAEGGVADQGAGASVVYGVEPTETASDHPKSGTDVKTETQKAERPTFESLIKGEYKADFDARVDGIVKDRLKNAKNAEKAYEPLMKVLAEKYDVDGTDVSAVLKALEEDESFYAEEAAERGMSVKELRELKRIQRENAELKSVIDNANRRQKEENQAKAIYSDWLKQSEALKQKFPNFNLETEMQNPEFVQAMNVRGMTVEKAFMLAHLNEIQPQLMQMTAEKVEQKVVNRIKARNDRPTENGTAAYNASVIRKTDPSKLDKNDLAEIERRVRAGERISFG